MSSEPSGSVTQWIEEVKSGDATAAQKLWDRYFSQLVSLAHRKLHHVPKLESDEEDVVVEALNSFFGGAKKSRFPRLADRSDLWSLLARIVEHKARDVRRRQAARKRGGGRTRVDIDLDKRAGQSGSPTLDELSLELREQLVRLQDERLCEIVILVLYGHTNAEIAIKLDIHVRTVERRRMLVRKRWQEEL